MGFDIEHFGIRFLIEEMGFIRCPDVSVGFTVNIQVIRAGFTDIPIRGFVLPFPIRILQFPLLEGIPEGCVCGVCYTDSTEHE